MVQRYITQSEVKRQRKQEEEKQLQKWLIDAKIKYELQRAEKIRQMEKNLANLKKGV